MKCYRESHWEKKIRKRTNDFIRKIKNFSVHAWGVNKGSKIVWRGWWSKRNFGAPDVDHSKLFLV